MDESSLQTLWQEQPIDPAVPSELSLKLTSVEQVDFARPTTMFRKNSAPPEAKRFRLFVAFASLAGVLFVVGVHSLSVKIAPQPGPTRKDELPRAPVPTVVEQMEEMLAECRTYSNTEVGLTDFPRALAACHRVLELDPIHAEANELVKRITVLQSCESDLSAARELVVQGRLEGAVERLALIHKGCESYLFRAMTLAKEPVRLVKKEASSDCLAYAKAGKWDIALPRCEVYARFACQTMDPGELYPPALMRTKLEGPLNPKTDWRPSDLTLVAFLRAREKLKLAPSWRCPELAAFRAPPAAPDPAALANAEFLKRFSVPEFALALTSYFRGDFSSAPVPLQKLLENMAKAQHHEQARALLLDINSAINLYENGVTELTNDRPERAAGVFQKALEVDERLVLGEGFVGDRRRELSKRVSFVRKGITESMASASYEKGKGFADRKDFRAACRVWKVGLSFSRSNIDLLKALTNVCTKRAQDAFERAHTCEQLTAALDFAVDGDGFKERIENVMESEGCR